MPERVHFVSADCGGVTGAIAGKWILDRAQILTDLDKPRMNCYPGSSNKAAGMEKKKDRRVIGVV